MKIIQEGRLKAPADPTYRAQCEACGTRFEFQRSEAAQSRHRPSNRAIRCPLMGCENLIDEERWVAMRGTGVSDPRIVAAPENQ